MRKNILRVVVPPLAEGKVVRSTKGGDGAGRQMIDDRRQIGSVPGNYFPLTAGSIVLGDFSTPLRCARNDSGFARQSDN